VASPKHNYTTPEFRKLLATLSAEMKKLPAFAYLDIADRTIRYFASLNQIFSSDSPSLVQRTIAALSASAHGDDNVDELEELLGQWTNLESDPAHEFSMMDGFCCEVVMDLTQTPLGRRSAAELTRLIEDVDGRAPKTLEDSVATLVSTWVNLALQQQQPPPKPWNPDRTS
jgi:hypothetical protein